MNTNELNVQDPKKQPNIILRYIMMGIAFTSLLLGIAGVFVPLLPTTPFVILSVWLFSKSSDRFYKALLAHKICGPPVKDYLSGRGIKKVYKVTALSFMWISLTASFLLSYARTDTLWVRILLPIIGAYVTWFILSKPTCPKDEQKIDEE